MNYKPNIFCSWNLKSNFVYYKPIEIYVDTFPKTMKLDSIVRIIIIQESHTTKGLVNFIQKNPQMYDYIFTYLDSILEINEKGVKFLCINTWIKESISNFKDKIFGVSTLVGGKNFAKLPGHVLRHEVWEKRKEITTPKYFYLSTKFKYDKGDYEKNLVLGDKKEPLFETMYHIAIENASINNMFTEKLIDCFQTFTIPIYWGADNIGDYFNTDGMLIAKNVDEIVELANSITPELYQSKKDVIGENYIKSLLYTNHTEILDRKLNEIFNGKI